MDEKKNELEKEQYKQWHETARSYNIAMWAVPALMASTAYFFWKELWEVQFSIIRFIFATLMSAGLTYFLRNLWGTYGTYKILIQCRINKYESGIYGTGHKEQLSPLYTNRCVSDSSRHEYCELDESTLKQFGNRPSSFKMVSCASWLLVWVYFLTFVFRLGFYISSMCIKI